MIVNLGRERGRLQSIVCFLHLGGTAVAPVSAPLNELRGCESSMHGHSEPTTCEHCLFGTLRESNRLEPRADCEERKGLRARRRIALEGGLNPRMLSDWKLIR